MITAELLFSKSKETLDSPVGLVTGKFKTIFAVEHIRREKPAQVRINQFDKCLRARSTLFSIEILCFLNNY